MLHFRKKNLPVPSLFKKYTFMKKPLVVGRSWKVRLIEAFLSGLETVQGLGVTCLLGETSH